MFFGESAHPMDAKGRVFVPKRLQDELTRDAEGAREAVLTRGFERCLFLFARPAFAQVLARMHTQPFGGAQLRQMQRQFFSNAYVLDLDSAGRLLIPEKLRAHAGLRLQQEVVMVGVHERAEIWDRAAWERYVAETDADFDRLDQVLTGGSPPAPKGDENGAGAPR